jgi:hypothetical protein
MNTGKINNILALFDKYRVCLRSDDAIATIVSKSDVVGESDNEVLYLGWESACDGDEYSIQFSEGGLNGAVVKNGMLVMEDTEGDDIEIEFQEIKMHYLVSEELD